MLCLLCPSRFALARCALKLPATGAPCRSFSLDTSFLHTAPACHTRLTPYPALEAIPIFFRLHESPRQASLSSQRPPGLNERTDRRLACPNEAARPRLLDAISCSRVFLARRDVAAPV